ncbi:MAG: amidase, partial [Actinomycetota bacterium]
MTPRGLCAAAAALRAGEVRATELLAQAVAAAEAAAALNAFAWLDADGARDQAARCDAAAARGEWRGPLHG